jgi:hypothetical protein
VQWVSDMAKAGADQFIFHLEGEGVWWGWA